MGLFGRPNIKKMWKKKNVEGLIKILTKPSTEKDLLSGAINALADLRDKRAVGPLILILKETLKEKENYRIRFATINALGKIGDSQAVGPLIEIFKKDKYPPSREKVTQALIEIGDTESVTQLKKLLKDSSYSIRWPAALFLGERGDSAAIPTLSEVLKDREASNRKKAVIALGKIGGPEAIELLSKALADRSTAVHDTAIKTLQKIGTKDALNAIEKHISSIRKEEREKEEERKKRKEKEGELKDKNKVICAGCNRVVDKIIARGGLTLDAPSSWPKFKNKAFLCSKCLESICGMCAKKKKFTGIPVSKAFMPQCPLCNGDLYPYPK